MGKPQLRKVSEPGELLAFLQTAYKDLNRTKIKQLLKYKCVRVNGREATRHDHPLAAGDEVEIRVDRRASSRASLPPGLHIQYEDDAFLVIHKPAGMLSVPAGENPEETALKVVTEYLSSGPETHRLRAHVVHRLDRHTSGLLVFAKSAAARAFFLDNWKRVEKRYLAIVEGLLKPEAGIMRSELKEDPDMRVRSVDGAERGSETAVTRYRVLKTGNQCSLVECILETGRKNQIRVQLSDLGHPILGDKKYGSQKNPCGRLALHAWRLRIPHPETGKIIEIESKLPESLARILSPDE